MSAIVVDYMPVRLREKNKWGERDILQEDTKFSGEMKIFHF